MVFVFIQLSACPKPSSFGIINPENPDSDKEMRYCLPA